MAGGSLYHDDGDDDAISDINVTPFVDVVLVLLVVFIVTAKLIVGVDIEKPKAESGGAVQSTLQISVKADGSLYVNGDLFSEDAAAIARIAQLAQAAQVAQPSIKVKAIIAGDTRSAYGHVMHAMDLAQRAGVSIALVNERP